MRVRERDQVREKAKAEIEGVRWEHNCSACSHSYSVFEHVASVLSVRGAFMSDVAMPCE